MTSTNVVTLRQDSQNTYTLKRNKFGPVCVSFLYIKILCISYAL